MEKLNRKQLLIRLNNYDPHNGPEWTADEIIEQTIEYLTDSSVTAGSIAEEFIVMKDQVIDGDGYIDTGQIDRVIDFVLSMPEDYSHATHTMMKDSDLETLQEIEVLLKHAKCPDELCHGGMLVYRGGLPDDVREEDCEWCKTRHFLLNNPDEVWL